MYVISMEFLSLSRRRSSARNVPSGEEQGEAAVLQAIAPGEHEMGREGGEKQEVLSPFPTSCARASSKFLPSPWLS